MVSVPILSLKNSLYATCRQLINLFFAFDCYTTISDSAFSSSVFRIKALMVSPACLASMAILLETRVQKCR